MESSYAPQSPDLSSYAPQSPDLSGTGFRPESPDLGLLGSPRFGDFSQHTRFPSGNGFGYQPTSIPQGSLYGHQPALPPRAMKQETDDEYLPDAAPAAKRGRKMKEDPASALNGVAGDAAFPAHTLKAEHGDPTLGCKLHTSFPVARIKRIMQADEDIGKVAQVTPTVVSRALELFMIKLISAAANQAKGPTHAGAPTPSKGPKRVLAQHLKRAVLAEENFDFLLEIVNKVPDAPTKAAAKKEAPGSDSEETKPKKKGKKRKDSGDDF